MHAAADAGDARAQRRNVGRDDATASYATTSAATAAHDDDAASAPATAPAAAPVAAVAGAGTRRLAAGAGAVALRSFLKARRVAAPKLAKAAASAGKKVRQLQITYKTKAGPKTIKILIGDV